MESLLDDELSTAIARSARNSAESVGGESTSGEAAVKAMEVDGAAEAVGGGEATAMAVDAGGDGSSGDEWSGFLASLLDGLALSAVREQKTLVKALTRLLPLVTRGEPPLLRQLLVHFDAFADFVAYDETRTRAKAL